MSTTSNRKRPLFTLVAGCYGVSRYVQDFIDSVDAQDLPEDEYEVVMVDDGSLDDTPEKIEAWAARRPGVVRVVRKENGGVGTARNAGQAIANGEWISFPDPDDILDPDYLSRVKTFLLEHPETDMVATNRWLYNDVTKELTDTHPLRRHFKGGDRLRNLALDDRYFHGSAPSSFFKLSRVRELDLWHDGRVRPNFEDGHYASHYLMDLPEPKLAFLSSARYWYRKERLDRGSALQLSMKKPDRFIMVPRHGYLDLLTTATEKLGRVPLWLQNFMIYELSYYLGREDSQAGRIAPPEVREELHDLMARCTALLEPMAVYSYSASRLRGTTRDIMAHGYDPDPWVADTALISEHDPDQHLVKLVYRFTGPQPEETVLLGGREVVPHAAKTRDVVIHDRVLLRERILWVPARRIRLVVNGRHLAITDAPAVPTLRVWPNRLPQRPGPLEAFTPAQPEPVAVDPDIDPKVVKRAASRRSRKRFADAWVLMDRIHNADDSAEHLFSWLREHQPQVNAFFVLEEGTEDWHRLRALHPDRVVAHDSEDWYSLMLNAVHLISSHADAAVCLPPQLRAYRPWPWKFTFLQHGVIKDDLSGWLNARPLDLFITSTVDEHASVVADGTTYDYTEKETALTGLPRFDLVHAAGRAVPEDARDLVLVSPTWRTWLVPNLTSGSQRRGAFSWFTESDYYEAWTGLLRSEELARVCREQGLQLALLPHPNMETALEGVDLPAHVQRLSFDGTDVRALFARAAAVVTDYSSTAFNAAYIERPVVYFQFDADEMHGGAHVGRVGYFDYVRDGFGPVASTLDEAVEALVSTLEGGRSTPEPYRQRIVEAFPHRDDQNRQRVYDAIVAMGRRKRPEFVADAPTP